MHLRDWILGLALNDMEPPKDAWIRARTMILGSKQVSDEERVMLESSSLGSVTQELRNLEAKHANESRTRGFASKARIKPILDGLVNLNTAISFMASLDPHGIAPLVWGGISIVTKVCMYLILTRLSAFPSTLLIAIAHIISLIKFNETRPSLTRHASRPHKRFSRSRTR